MKQGKKQDTPVLSTREVEDLKGKIAEDEAYLAQVKGHPADAGEAHLPASDVIETDTASREARIRRNKEAIDRLGPDAYKMTGAEKMRAEARYKEIKELISDYMLTAEEMSAYPSATDALKNGIYQRAIKRALDPKSEHSPWFIGLANEAKRIATILWPDDPTMRNLENWRKSSGVSGRHFDK